MLAGKLVFAAGNLGDYDIFLYDFGTAKTTQLTSGEAWNDYPRFSPDARRIAFGSTRSGKQEIWVMNADGSEPRSLTAQLKWADFPTWSPDGKEIAFVSNEFFQVDLFALSLETGTVRRLTKSEGLDGYPDWSSDGRTIAFSSDRGIHRSIYRLNLETLDETRITSELGHDSAPAFSPDGRKLAFVSERPDQERKTDFMRSHWDLSYGHAHSDIWIMKLASGDRKQITNSGVDRNVRWSPDGKYIAYTSSPLERHDAHILLCELETGTVTPLSFDEKIVRRELEQPMIAELKKPLPQTSVLHEGRVVRMAEAFGQKWLPYIEGMTPDAVRKSLSWYTQWVMDRMNPVTARHLDWK